MPVVPDPRGDLMRNAALFLLVLSVCSATRADDRPGPAAPRVFQFDGARIAEVRRRIERGDARLSAAVDRLRARADEAMRTPVLSVADKPQTPPSGDKHDYLSMAPYWWPDPDKPDGKPYIRKDGRVNPE